jgi:hypothetical protein
MSLSIPTSAITFVETEHGRLRRRQRGIDKKDLQAAKKYGARTDTHPRPNGDPTSKYSYRDIVYIVNDATGEEVTSYAVPIELDLVPVSTQVVQDHERARKKIQQDLDSWTSNTVLVVDRSGSMKNADVWGTRNRLSAVWLAAALDFVANRLESGDARSTDVISIVTLEQNPVIVLRNEPLTWVLYNKIASIYNSQSIEPRGHGPFLPSLKLAEELLLYNPCASCAVGLLFLSDGKPSDMYKTYLTVDECNDMIFNQVQVLSMKFGRRLTFQAVGLGDHEFNTLKGMVDVAADYGVKAELCTPSMNTLSLGEAFTSVATSVTSTITEMTDISTLKQSKVRDILRESRTSASTHITTVSSTDFWIYGLRSIQRKVYSEFWEEGPNGERKLSKCFEEMPLQNTEARYVAFAKEAFGEGAERFAFRFFELSFDAQTIVGKPLVAKESRFILEDDTRARDKYVHTFCSTQQLARRLAKEFNDKLNKLRRVDPKTPRISFLDCSIYELDDINLGKQKVLVEEKLDHNKWCKWNSNNGFVEGMKNAPVFSEDGLHNAIKQLANIAELDMIAEGSDYDDSSDENDGDVYRFLRKSSSIIFTPFEVAQAFSHYTYLATGKKRLVCDLQGVYEEKGNELKLSDPVIHYYNENRSDRRFVHGKTDRGRKGIAMFFDTHKEHCGHLCKLVNGGFWKHGRFPTSRIQRSSAS